jgi:ABC-type branched-subunit amino acid transport system substrate-binding protein
MKPQGVEQRAEMKPKDLFFRIPTKTPLRSPSPPPRKAAKEVLPCTLRKSAALVLISLMIVSCGAASYKCVDPLGCLEITPGSSIVIGAILATSGEQRSVGSASLQSVEKAVADKGTLLGHPIHLINYGTDCTAGSAIAGATEFATYTDLTAAIGPTCSDEAIAATPILADAGIPLLGPAINSSTAYALTTRVLTAIQQVAVRMPDKTLYIPRQALFSALGLSR